MEVITFKDNGVEYTLTKRQIEAAYRYQNHQYELETATEFLRREIFGQAYDCPESQEAKENLSYFERDTGLTENDAMALAERVVTDFDRNYNIDEAEYAQWEHAVKVIIYLKQVERSTRTI